MVITVFGEVNHWFYSPILQLSALLANYCKNKIYDHKTDLFTSPHDNFKVSSGNVWNMFSWRNKKSFGEHLVVFLFFFEQNRTLLI